MCGGFLFTANKNRQRRGKEEKAALSVYENSQTFAAVEEVVGSLSAAVAIASHWQGTVFL